MANFLELRGIQLEPQHSDVLDELYCGCFRVTCTKGDTQCGP